MDFVSVSGYGSTGSSAVVDLLSEFSGVYIFPGEFRLIQDPDGLMDLCHNVANSWGWLQCDAYVRRFIRYTNLLARRGNPVLFGERYEEIFGGRFLSERDRFLSRIIDVQSPGYWQYHDYHDANFVQVFVEKSKRSLSRIGFSYKLVRKITKKRPLYFVRHDCDVYGEARLFLERLFSPLAQDHKASIVVFDQGFLPYNRKETHLMLPDLKLIVVDRDPRDVYLDAKSYNAYPITDDPKDFVSFFESSHSCEPEGDDESTLFVRFERLIFDYEHEVPRIREFVNLADDDHIRPNSRLRPDDSRRNIGTLKNARSSVENEHIDAIERNLAEWCYQNVMDET